jgi:hypothetical protein
MRNNEKGSGIEVGRVMALIENTEFTPVTVQLRLTITAFRLYPQPSSGFLCVPAVLKWI